METNSYKISNCHWKCSHQLWKNIFLPGVPAKQWCRVWFSPVCLSVFVCLCAITEKKRLIISECYLVGIFVLVPARSVEIVVTLDLDFWPWKLFSYFWIRKLPTSRLLMQFCVVMYLTWFCKLSSECIWPSLLTMRAISLNLSLLPKIRAAIRLKNCNRE